MRVAVSRASRLRKPVRLPSAISCTISYPPAGFRYPPDKTTREIEHFAGTNDIHLQLLPVLIE